jgi:DNA-binding response OmpR family regulator/anti-sigma regulatory factor (Ser/Thr protein kinase)
MMKPNSTILIVDDQASARQVLKGVLQGQDYELAFAGLGREALALAAKLAPDLILLDVMMPEMDGFEVCRRLRADPRLAEVPILMITALDDRDSRLRGLEAGVDDFITKPFDPVELRARVRAVTRLNRYRQLVASRTKFEWVVEQAGEGYLLLDDQDTILYANAQACLYLGLPAEADRSDGTTFLQVVRPHYRFEPAENWVTWPDAPAAGPQSARYLVRPEAAAAGAFWLQVAALELPAGPGGNWLIQLKDVTAHMELQRNVWVFQSLVSHKLRTPLVGLISGLDLLEDDGIKERLDASMTELYELVTESARRLHQNVEGITEYLETPDLLQSDTGFDLLQLEPIVEQLSRELGLKSPGLQRRTALETAPVSLSEAAVTLILRELLENAIKFHPQARPKLEILLFSPNEKQVGLRVGDDGLTLSPAQLARVWKPYYQAEKYFTGEVVGMGLGLPGVATLVWGVGGSCRLYNREPGPGLIVEIILPITN